MKEEDEDHVKISWSGKNTHDRTYETVDQKYGKDRKVVLGVGMWEDRWHHRNAQDCHEGNKCSVTIAGIAAIERAFCTQQPRDGGPTNPSSLAALAE